jgi:phage FluMu protein Com
MEPINVFNSVEYMEQKCPKCSSKIDYGVTTEWDEKEQAHRCKNCGELLK